MSGRRANCLLKIIVLGVELLPEKNMTFSVVIGLTYAAQVFVATLVIIVFCGDKQEIAAWLLRLTITVHALVLAYKNNWIASSSSMYLVLMMTMVWIGKDCAGFYLVHFVPLFLLGLVTRASTDLLFRKFKRPARE
jgi:hypothetical protein